MRFLTLGLLLAISASGPIHATTVVPPSFDELVQGSSLIFRGRVAAVKTVWTGPLGQPHLATRVTFAVQRVLRGNAGTSITLQFLGGMLDHQKLLIAGIPQFVVGERGVYFVENPAGRFCPIMRLGHGRYRVEPDEAGRAHITRDDHAPLLQVAGVSAPLRGDTEPQRAALGVPAKGMRLEDFESAILDHSNSRPTVKSEVTR